VRANARGAARGGCLRFGALEAALIDELAPVGALQAILAQRIAVATWRLGRVDRLEAEVLEFRGYGGAGSGLALIRDGNGTRSIETLLRYRGGALAELIRSLRTLQALQAEADVPAERVAGAALALKERGGSAAVPAPIARPSPKKPERRSINEYALHDRPEPCRTLHELPAYRTPNEPEPGRDRHEAPVACPRHESVFPSRPNDPQNAKDSAAEPRPGDHHHDHSKPALRSPSA
jgi:hypothetical protein